MIEEAVRRHNGDKKKAAEELGINERTIRRKLKAWADAEIRIKKAS